MSYINTNPALTEIVPSGYQRAVRSALRVARLVNGIFHIYGGSMCIVAAIYLFAVELRHDAFWYLIAFLAAWFGIALICEGLDLLMPADSRLGTSPTYPSISRKRAPSAHGLEYPGRSWRSK